MVVFVLVFGFMGLALTAIPQTQVRSIFTRGTIMYVVVVVTKRNV